MQNNNRNAASVTAAETYPELLRKDSQVALHVPYPPGLQSALVSERNVALRAVCRKQRQTRQAGTTCRGELPSTAQLQMQA